MSTSQSTKRKTKTKLGMVRMQRPEKGVMKKWKAYKYSATAMYLLYFKSDDMRKPDGQILLTSITKLDTDYVKDASFPLQVHFRGKPERGPGSPWVLDLASNADRIDWMETILPGSSEYLVRFSKQGSLHKTVPVSPKGTESPTLTTDGSTYHYGMQQNVDLPAQPSNYIDPVSMGTVADTYHNGQSSQNPARVQTRTVHGSDATANLANLSLSLDSATMAAARAESSQQNHYRHTHNRATFTHGERDHPPVQLARSLTEQEMNKSPEHLYEVEALDFTWESRPPISDRPSVPTRLPPTAKPRVKRPPPRVREGSDSTSHEVSFAGNVTVPQEDEERTGKEAEYDIPATLPQAAPRTAVKTGNSPLSQSSAGKHKPPITPRRQGTHQGGKPTKQADYLDLVNDASEAGTNGSSGNVANNVPQSPPVAPQQLLNEEMFQNFTQSQLDLLTRMLQQVQGGGQRAPQLSRSMDAATPMENGHTRKQFERAISYTPQLHTDKILVVDEEDGYEARPDWAKAVSAGRSGDDQSSADADILSDLQEEALYISRSRLKDFSVIGEGQFGKVFHAVMQRGSEPVSVAVKTAKKSTTEKEKAEFLREMNIMSQMVHPNIVQLYGVIRDDVPAPWIVLEYLCHGDIKSFLTKNHRPVERLVKYMIDVSMGMHYLAEKGLVHRDLAARNVLVGENETCKVSDFGLLRELPKDDSIYCMQTNVPCPVRWMPPESIEERKFSHASDVWSFGILLWEMFNPRKTPYEKLGNIEVAMKVIKGLRLEIPSQCPSVIGRIMKACWHQKPEKRPSFLLISTLLTTKVTFPSQESGMGR